jgi:uncharacterized cupin superfamily protein
VAHQIVDTGATEMRYLTISTSADIEACEYPDSGKVSVVVGKRGARTHCKMFLGETTVDYYGREEK